MVNPDKITNYNLTDFELEENLIFWVLVTGKTASVTARNLVKLLFELCVYACEDDGNNSPLSLIRRISVYKDERRQLSNILKECGFGCYNLKAKSLKELAFANLNLRTCSIDDLEKISGIGRKTSRCFIMHTRKNAHCAGLDTHLLKFLNDLGYNVPRSTPGSGKVYKQVENQLLALFDKKKRTPAELDLLIWRVYSKHPHLKGVLLKSFT